jgi:GAF domain-containing protein
LPQFTVGPSSLDDIIIAPDAAGTDADHESKVQALLAVSQVLATNPDHGVERLVNAAMKLTGADSAGVSLEGSEQGAPVFRWVATAGVFARYLNGTMPRHFSPCGTVLDRGTTLVMRDPVRHFKYLADLHASVRTALLVPFRKQGKLVGTVWVVSHSEDKSFTTEDVRTVQDLTSFASSLLDVLQATSRPRASN